MKISGSVKLIFITVFLFPSLFFEAVAQERSTQSPEVKSFFLNPDLKGIGQNSVNLYSGDVNLPLNLLTITGRGGLTANVSAFYNSNIQNQRDVWALEAPTSILGLGWSMDYDRIVVDHKNTGTVHDDDFYLIIGGSSNQLIMTSSTGVNGIKTFETKNYQFWKITYYKSDERWEIIKEDGTTYVFGGGVQTENELKKTPGNVVQWGVKWGNWIGSSGRTQGQQQHAIGWNLSKVRNTWGDEISYEYLAVEEEVGRYGESVEPKKHTKASYLQKIVSPEGKEIEFIYQEKLSDEYTDPHQELTIPYDLYVAINGPNHIEVGDPEIWTADIGAGTTPYSYDWEYQVNGNGAWLNAPNQSTFSITANDNMNFIQIKLTVTDSNGKTNSSSKFIIVTEDGQIDPLGCEIDCSPSLSISENTSSQSVTHYEPDAYQEKYEDKYLSRIAVKNISGKVLYHLDFKYGFYGTQGAPDFKRLLTGVTQEYPNGESLPDLNFEYYNSSATHPAALKKVTYPAGAEVTYTYSEKSLTRTNRDYTIDRPVGYEDPRVWIGNDYVVVTWNQADDSDTDPDDDIYLQVFTWDGEWIPYTHGVITDTGKRLSIAPNSSDQYVQNFEIFPQDDFFVLVTDYYEPKTVTSGYLTITSRKALVFNKNKNNSGDWDLSYLEDPSSYLYPDCLSFSSFLSKTEVVTGSDYIAISDLGGSSIYTFKWNGNIWEFTEQVGSSYGGNNNFLGGSDNYFIVSNPSSSSDQLQSFYLDELNEWDFNTLSTSYLTSNIGGLDHHDRNYISAGNSMFAISLQGDDEYIFRLTENYSFTGALNIGSINNVSPMYIANDELVLFAQSTGEHLAEAHRFDGISWYQTPTSFFNDGTRTMSVGADLLLKRREHFSYEDAGYITFNPNTSYWESTKHIHDNISGTEARLYTDVAGNTLAFGNKVLYRMPSSTLKSLQDLQYASGRHGNYLSLRASFNFLAYESDSDQNLVEPKSHLKIIKNGDDYSTINLTDLNSYSKRLYNSFVSNKSYQKSNFVGSSIVITYNTDKINNASKLVLHKIIDDKAIGTIKDYPAIKVEVSNGYKESEVDFVYAMSNATVDPTGTFAQYNKVTTKAGNPSEGHTESYFFNGLSDTELSDNYPANSPFTNAGDYLTQVQSLLYKQKVYNNNDDLLTETTNHWKVFEKPITRVSDNKQIDKGHYVRQMKTESMVDGVTTTSISTYNSVNGLANHSETTKYDVDGNGYLVSSDITFGFEEYTQLENKHILSPVVERREYSATNLLTSKSVTTWKDWGSGKWAPHKSYMWDGDSYENFNYSNWSGSGSAPASWIKTSEITKRDAYGNINETKDAEGIFHTSIAGLNGSLKIGTFTNAKTDEVKADGFDGVDLDDVIDWYAFDGGNWRVEDGVLKANKTGSYEAYLHSGNSENLEHSSSIIEFDAKFTSGGNGWFGLHFMIYYPGFYWFDGGKIVKFERNGDIALTRSTTTVGTGSISGSMDKWRNIRIVTQPSGKIMVYVDGEQVLEATDQTGVNNTNYGFILKNAAIEIDNFRIYPNDAVASSIGYDPLYHDVISKTNADGNTTRIHKDEHRNTIDVLNYKGLVMSSSSQRMSRNNSTGDFNPSSPNAAYSATFPNGNVLYNSGFELGEGVAEEDVEYWYKDSGGGFTILAGGEFKRLKNKGYSGNYALIFSENAGDSFTQKIYDPHFLWPDKKYYLRFWVKVDGGGTADPTITATLSKDGSSQQVTASKMLTSSSWTLFEADLGSGSDWDDHSSFSYLSISSDITMELLFDDFYLTEIEYEDQSGPTHSATYATSYTDGSGKEIQQQVWGGNSSTSSYSVSHTEYDDLGRKWRSWRSYNFDTQNKYDANYNINAQSYYGTGSSVRLYTENKYYSDPLSRIKSTLPAGTGTEKIEYNYGSETLSGVLFPKTTVTDLGNITSVSFSDYSGQTIRSTSAVGTTEEIISSNIYDPYNRIAESRPPHYFDPPSGSVNTDWISTSKSDFLGRTIEATTTDGGISQMKYDKSGRLRFSQSAEQASAGKVSFTSYDDRGRPAFSGEAATNFSNLDGDQSYSFEDIYNLVSISKYDETPTTNEFPWAYFGSQMNGIKSKNSLNSISSEAYRMDGKANPSMFDFEWQVVIYSYDFEGRVEKKWILTQDKPNLKTEITYTFNESGQVTQQHVKVGANNDYYHFYTYDQQNRLKEVYVNDNNTRPNNPTTTYSYDAEGKITTKNIEGVSLASFSNEYDNKGRLTKITTGPNNFEQNITYDPDGSIQQIVSDNNGVDHTYSYSYDNLGRLITADYSSPSTGTNSFDVKNITYDKHGNILSLDRYRENSTKVDELIYNYSAGTNKLSSVDEQQSWTSSIDWDAEDHNFNYDLDGNLQYSSKVGGGGFDAIDYNLANLPIKVITDYLEQSDYYYNSTGWRIMKHVKDQTNGSTLNKEYYIMDGSTLLAVTDGSGNVKHWNMYGNELLGREEANGERRFYVYDHLGSTRQVVDADFDYIFQEFDYYPFGLVRRASTITGTTKETFTGKELDEETNLYYFGARYYDAALGRWSVTDPAGQFHTPYAYANNPVSYVDPDGEFAQFVILGAMIGASLGSMQAGMRGENPYWGMLKGGVIGAATSALGAAVQPVGIAAGAAFGGGVGGATYGAQTLVNSDKFDWGDFGRSVGIGAITGAVDGGIRAYQRGHRNILTGDYTNSYKDHVRRSIIGGNYNPNGPVPKEELQNFVESTHSNLYVEAGRPILTAGAPEGTSIKNGLFDRPDGLSAGLTYSSGLPGSRSEIFIAPSTFEKATKLYLTTGHELIHAKNYFLGVTHNWGSIFSSNGYPIKHALIADEVYAHQWSLGAAKKLFMYKRQRHHQQMINFYKNQLPFLPW